MQYVMHHPELMRIKSIPTFNYLIINGGILIVIRYLSESSPTISLEQLIDGLGNMVIRYIAGEMQDALWNQQVTQNLRGSKSRESIDIHQLARNNLDSFKRFQNKLNPQIARPKVKWLFFVQQ